MTVSGSEIANSYWDKDVSGISSGDYGVGLTTTRRTANHLRHQPGYIAGGVLGIGILALENNILRLNIATVL